MSDAIILCVVLPFAPVVILGVAFAARDYLERRATRQWEARVRAACRHPLNHI